MSSGEPLKSDAARRPATDAAAFWRDNWKGITALPRNPLVVTRMLCAGALTEAAGYSLYLPELLGRALARAFPLVLRLGGWLGLGLELELELELVLDTGLAGLRLELLLMMG